MHKHQFTVAESFGGLGIAITVSMDDKPAPFPAECSGKLVACRDTRMGKVAHKAIASRLPDIADRLAGALLDDYTAMCAERRAVQQQAIDKAIAEATVKAETETATKIAEGIAQAQAIFDQSAADIAEKAMVAIERANKAEAELAALKTAKKRAAAIKGHRAHKGTAQRTRKAA